MELIKGHRDRTTNYEHAEWQKEAYKKAYIDTMSACFRTAWRANPSLCEPELASMIEFTQSIKDKLVGKAFTHVTMSFKYFLRGSPRKVREFNNLILNKIVTKKWIIHWAYAWEFVKEDGNYGHPHVHMLLYHAPKGMYEIRREFKRTLDKIQKNDEYITAHCIDIKPKCTLNAAKNAYEYLHKSRIGDMIERCELHIDEIYENQNQNFEKIFSSLVINGLEDKEVVRGEEEIHQEEDT